MSHLPNPHDFYIDANGMPTEVVDLDGVEVHRHYDDVPDSDLTVVNGLPCTTALRAVLDVAVEMDPLELDRLVTECLDRGFFTPREAFDRIAQPDMLARQGALRVAGLLFDKGYRPW
jgi:hypothetical protein